jgi:hypothetical protein
MSEVDASPIQARTYDDRLVFDPVLWGGKDVGDNAQFWQRATILDVYPDRDGRDMLATVRFHHDGRVSRGHFMRMMRDAS